MKKIQIIRGTYGFKQNDSASICPKTVKDPPFEVGEKEAKRLVQLGVAIIIENEDGDDKPYSKKMKLEELRKVAENHGVENVEKLTTKDMAIVAIEEVLNERV